MEEEMMELTPEELAPCKELDDLTIVTIPEENQVPGNSQKHTQEHIIVKAQSTSLQVSVLVHHDCNDIVGQKETTDDQEDQREYSSLVSLVTDFLKVSQVISS